MKARRNNVKTFDEAGFSRIVEAVAQRSPYIHLRRTPNFEGQISFTRFRNDAFPVVLTAIFDRNSDRPVYQELALYRSKLPDLKLAWKKGGTLQTADEYAQSYLLDVVRNLDDGESTNKPTNKPQSFDMNPQ